MRNIDSNPLNLKHMHYSSIMFYGNINPVRCHNSYLIL